MAAVLKRLSFGPAGSDAKLSDGQRAFKDSLTEEAKAYFDDISRKPFSEQAVAFLNAYWDEVGDQAEFIFSMALKTLIYADAHTRGISLMHLYDENSAVDFTTGLYFYEQLCKRVLDDPAGKKWRDDPQYAASMPEMMTAIVRKKLLRDKVDVDFDGRVSFLEYLLFQYGDIANPADFLERSMASADEHPQVRAARLALEAVNEAIRAYEAEKHRLTEGAKLPGVKGLTHKHGLSMLLSSPIGENLQVALIKAEAAVRTATKVARAEAEAGTEQHQTAGALWWMNRDLQEKKEMYGPRRT